MEEEEDCVANNNNNNSSRQKGARARHVWLLLFSSKKVAPFVGRSKRSLFSESALMMMRFFVSLCCKVLVLVFGGILV